MIIFEKTPFTFTIIDLDNFKSINDTFGHGVGDQVIIQVAKCLKSTFREHDIVFRLGGDEFSAYAAEVTTKKIANQIIKRFIANLETIVIPELGDRTITASIAFDASSTPAIFPINTPSKTGTTPFAISQKTQLITFNHPLLLKFRKTTCFNPAARITLFSLKHENVDASLFALRLCCSCLPLENRLLNLNL